ncbi:hypothetical protein PM082_012568 [Marasmius tenuissimus]|nr:hypothetical protein PM082_012568 [Marasmius tenuissimus]
MHTTTKLLLFPISLALNSQVLAICPESKLGIGNVIRLKGQFEVNRWNVYDKDCNIIDGLTTNNNPCTVGMFGCSPDPILFVRYTNSFDGSQYQCQPAADGDACDRDIISVCCN